MAKTVDIDDRKLEELTRPQATAVAPAQVVAPALNLGAVQPSAEEDEADALKRSAGRQERTLRANPREHDSIRRAEDRAAEIRSHKGRDVDAIDKFFIPSHWIPEGWTYEWKTLTVAGKTDRHYMTSLRHGGWEPVPVERHPDAMPEGSTGYIEIEGNILMERPKVITDEARNRELREARLAVHAKEVQMGQTPAGTLPRDANPAVAPNVRRSIGPVEIPADA